MFFAFAYLCIAWHRPLLILFSTINNILTSVNNSNSILVFFKNACYANPGAGRKWARSSFYITIHLFPKFSNISASNNVSLCTYKSRQLPMFLLLKFLNAFSACLLSTNVMLSMYFKNLLCQLIIFHKIFPSYPCIHINKLLFLITIYEILQEFPLVFCILNGKNHEQLFYIFLCNDNDLWPYDIFYCHHQY